MTLALWNLVVASALLSLIWIVQLVHYPLFRHYAIPEFSLAMAEHQRRIFWVVGPLLLAELGLGLALIWASPSLTTYGLVGLTAVIWALTALHQVPCHQRLLHGKDGQTIERLVLTNWWRTGLWSLRFLISLQLVRAA